MRTAIKKNAAVSLFFAAFMFLQFVILRMGNQAGRGFLADGQQEKVYIFLQVFVIGGVALHGLLHPLLKSGSGAAAAAVLSLALCGV